MQVIGEVGRVGADVLDSWCLAASRVAAARGVVGIVDMERPWSLDAWLRAYRRRESVAPGRQRRSGPSDSRTRSLDASTPVMRSMGATGCSPSGR